MSLAATPKDELRVCTLCNQGNVKQKNREYVCVVIVVLNYLAGMVTEIIFNKNQLYGKVAVLVSISLLLLGAIYLLNHPNTKHYAPPSLAGPVFFIVFCVFIIFIVLIQLFNLSIGVTIDNSSQELRIKFLTRKTRIILVNEIDSYSSTQISARSNYYDGILLYVRGQKFLLSDFNLSDYKPILSFLEEEKIIFDGKEKFKFIAYYSQRFRM